MIKIKTSLFFFISFFTLHFQVDLFSQEKTVNVERSKALDQTSPIHNIWVDDENIKWVANGKGLNKVLDLNTVEKVSVPAGTTSLLMIRGGNAQLEWNTADMQNIIGNVTISCASYNPKTKTIWMGTRESGAFEVSLSPLRVVQRLSTDNKKLTSNQINDIFIRNNGTIFIATDDGMLTGSGEKWSLTERYLNFIGVDAWEDNVWILGDDFLWQVDNKGKWTPIAIELRNVEGQMRDIAVDDEGRVWIASNMMTGYDVNAEKYQRFGPGQYFTSQFVNCLDVDHDGSIWTGTADKGLYLIQWESSLILSVTQDSPLDCKSANPNAEISVKVAGGQAPYTYLWNKGQTTPKISQLLAGEYKVTVTDANGLVKTGSYEIKDPAITATVVQIKPSTGSAQGDASADLAVIGGTGQFTYKWDNGELTPTATKLTSGAHTVTVTDKSGCSAVATVNITETVSSLSVSISTVKENKCVGGTDGEIKAEAIGGKAPYKYSWSSKDGTDASLKSLGAGSYTVSVTDAAGQVATYSMILTSPTTVTATVQITVPATANASNGQALAKAAGGKAPYTFQWNNGDTNPLNKSLSPGENSVTVTDANGCTGVATINMTENIEDMSASIIPSGEIKCPELKGIDLSVEVTGGKAPYVYSWENGQKTEKLQGVMAGTYRVTITDVRGAKVTASTDIKQPASLSVSIQSDAAATTNETNGRATAKVTGGSGVFDFSWDNGEKTNKASKLTAGKHTVTVTDGAGCTAIAEVDIPENILALQVSLDQVGEIICAGDNKAAIKPTVTGGKEPYTYIWSNASTASSLEKINEGLFTLTVADATGHTATTAITIDAPPALQLKLYSESPSTSNQSNGRVTATVTGGRGKYTYQWDNGEKTAKAEKLSAGSHSLTVTDENGCTVEGNVVVSENILPLAVDISQTEKIICSGQSGATLLAEVKGGKEPYTYDWTGAGKSWATNNISGVGAGTYTLKLKDAAGTVVNETFIVKEPEPFKVEVVNVSPASTGNADGELTLKITGGTLPYSFRNTVLQNTTTNITVDKLSPGLINIDVTDAAGCAIGTSVTIKEDILPLSVTIKETKSVLCNGSADATLIASAKGGKAPYQFKWNNGIEGVSLSNVAAGSYAMFVKDASGQESRAEWIVKAPAPFTVDIVNLRSATNDRISDGKGAIKITGGASPYTYSWSSGETTSQASKLPLGQGRVVVTDQNGCAASAEFIVKEKVLAELTAERLASGEPIRMEKIQFQADSVKVEPEAFPSLDELFEFLYDNPTVIIEVAGHTNGLPADEYCDRISSERAKSVADYLINKGIENRRVISKGYGKRKPVATNQTPEGRKRNQRVEIRLIKIEE